MRIQRGQIYVRKGGGDKYILAQTDFDKACLIDLQEGNRYVDAVRVSSGLDITKEEFTAMGGDDFDLKHDYKP